MDGHTAVTPQPATGRSAHRAAGIVALAVIGSRILGLVREIVFAALFGAGKYFDAFLAAFQIPNLLRDLFAEGALSTAFTATFAKTYEREGPEPAWKLANLLLSAMIVVMGVVCLLGILASPLVVQITSYGFHAVPGKFELTVRLTRILFPFILMLSLAAVVMGVLNARFVFGLPASASTVFNLVSVVLGVVLAFVFEPQPDWRHPHFTERALYGVSLGVLLGGLAQLGIQLPRLWRLGFRFRWRLELGNERLRQVWRLAWPSMIAGAAVQVNVLVIGMLASEINGARSWLNYAFRLMQFPIGVFGVAVATVTLPAVARHHAREDLAAVGRQVEESLRLALYLTLPAAVGLAVLAPEIIAVIYQRGRFTAQDTALTAAALRAFAVGLAGYAAIKVLVPCFYALDRRWRPLQVSVVGIAVNLVVSLLLVKVCGFGHVGLAATTAAVALVNFGQLVMYLRREVAFGSAARWAGFLGRVGAAAALCGAAAAVGLRLAEGLVHGYTGRILGLAVALAAGVVAYGTVTWQTGLEEPRRLLAALRRGGATRPATAEPAAGGSAQK